MAFRRKLFEAMVNNLLLLQHSKASMLGFCELCIYHYLHSSYKNKSILLNITAFTVQRINSCSIIKLPMLKLKCSSYAIKKMCIRDSTLTTVDRVK